MEKTEVVTTPSSSIILTSAEDELLQQKLHILETIIFRSCKYELQHCYESRLLHRFKQKKHYFRNLQRTYNTPSLLAMINKIELVFGKDNCDFTLEYGVIVKLGDFEIINSLGQIHQVKGFFFNFCFSEEEWVLRCNKTEWDMWELRCNNPHPHANCDSHNGFHNLCYGSGQLGYLLSQINNWHEFDQNIFEFFLVSIPIYFKWESIEGGPYKRLDELYHYSSSYSYCTKNKIKKSLKEYLIALSHIHEVSHNYYVSLFIYSKRLRVKLDCEDCEDIEFPLYESGTKLFNFRNKKQYINIIPKDKQLYEQSSKPKRGITAQTSNYGENIRQSIAQKYYNDYKEKNRFKRNNSGTSDTIACEEEIDGKDMVDQ